MSRTSDIGTTDTHGDEGGMDPREAASLLERTQPRLDFRSPWLPPVAAGVVLVELFHGEAAVSRVFLDVIHRELVATLRETLRPHARLAASL